MGLFDRLLKKDPSQELARARALLDKGEPERALKVARRLLKRGGPTASQAQDLIEKAELTMVEDLLAAAGRSEQQDAFIDAADWIEAALPYVNDPVRTNELENQIRALRQRVGEETGPRFEPAPESGELEGDEELDPQTHFYTLIGMLREDIADRYEQLPEAFREAFLQMNNGQIEAARATLDVLVESHPQEALIRFERGRCALMQGDAACAREDLDEVSAELGEEPLDLSGSLYVVGLWSEAMLTLEEAGPVVEKLAPIADPARNNPGLSMLYAMALEKAGQPDEAANFLLQAGRRFDKDPNFPLQLARILARRGDHLHAIECLEASVAPSCSGGSCMGPAKHAPSLRLLISLYLENELKTKRVEELMMHLEQAIGGFRLRGDLELLAKWHEHQGDKEAAEQARKAALDAGEQGITQAMSASAMLGSDKAIL